MHRIENITNGIAFLPAHRQHNRDNRFSARSLRLPAPYTDVVDCCIALERRGQALYNCCLSVEVCPSCDPQTQPPYKRTDYCFSTKILLVTCCDGTTPFFESEHGPPIQVAHGLHAGFSQGQRSNCAYAGELLVCPWLLLLLLSVLLYDSSRGCFREHFSRTKKIDF